MPRGDCYSASLDWLVGQWAAGDDAARLCHGTAVGTGGEVKGERYGHAWIEFTDARAELVLDVANDEHTVIPRAIYYAVGQIENVRRYDGAEAAAHALDCAHYGPWEETTAVDAGR